MGGIQFASSLSWHPGPLFLCLSDLISSEIDKEHTDDKPRETVRKCVFVTIWESNAGLSD